jgi:Na+/melibiose symporter-like transporter
MKLILKLLCLVPLGPGLALLVLGVARYRLPYEDGRYFDAEQGAVYHLQAAEAYTIAGILLSVAGAVVAVWCFRRLRSRPPESAAAR